MEDALSDLPLPEGVVGHELVFGDDSEGEPAVWVWIIVDNGAADQDWIRANSMRTFRLVHDAVRNSGSDR